MTKKRNVKKRKRKSKLAVGFTVFIIFALVIGVALSVTVLFPIKNVLSSGSKLYTEKEIVEISGITEENNLFILSESAVADNLHKSLPYIDKVTLERKFPDTIKIKVTDAEEYACFKVGDSYFVTSKSGYIVNSYPEKPENTFEIEATKVKCKVGYPVEYKNENEKEFVDILVESLKKKNIKIDKITVKNYISKGISATVEGKYEVNFGSNQNLENKIAHLRGMLDAISEDRIGTIDLSMWSAEKPRGSFKPKKAE